MYIFPRLLAYNYGVSTPWKLADALNYLSPPPSFFKSWFTSLRLGMIKGKNIKQLSNLTCESLILELKILDII